MNMFTYAAQLDTAASPEIHQVCYTPEIAWCYIVTSSCRRYTLLSAFRSEILGTVTLASNDAWQKPPFSTTSSLSTPIRTQFITPLPRAFPDTPFCKTRHIYIHSVCSNCVHTPLPVSSVTHSYRVFLQGGCVRKRSHKSARLARACKAGPALCRRTRRTVTLAQPIPIVHMHPSPCEIRQTCTVCMLTVYP